MNRYEGSPAVIIERRKGTPDSPFNNMNESLVVSNDGKVILSEIPNELNRVIITSDDGATWFEVTEGQIPENGFKVDYINKIVTFNTINVGKQLHFKYLGEGNHYYSPNSIYTKLNEGTVVETLGGLIENSHEALDALERLDEKLNEVTQATNNAIIATNDTKEVITEGNQVIATSNEKITEMDGKINEASTKMSELDTKLNQAETTISDVQQKSTMVEAIINDGQVVIEDAELLINEVKSAGKFNLSTPYKKNNTVLDNGSTWIALQDTQNNPLPVLPIVENTYWRLAALHGSKGDKGDTGAALSILGKLTDPSQLPPTGQAGQAYTVNGELYVWSENLDAWENVGNIKGEKGDTGDTGEEGKSAYEVAVVNGFVGTQEEWLASLKGEKGDEGKDADLTEINQEIANIKQTVTNNQQVVAEHLDQDVLSEDGAHGIRYFNDKLETKNGNTWSEIEIDKSNARGTQSLSPYHAIRRFPVFNGWANDSTAESLWLVFKDMTLNGQLLIRGAVHNGISTANAGGFEYSLNVFRLVGDTSSLANPTEILYLGSYVADRFVLGSQVVKVTTKQPLIPITKRKSNAAIYLEIEYLTGEGNAFEALDSIEFELQVPEATPNESPKQQSIFTHVGNSKQNLATAITGKGVTTSADATFAQMVANINAIPTGKKQASGTTNSSSGNLSFSYYGGGGSQSAPSLNLLLPFKPSVVYAVYEASGLYYTTLFSSNALEGKSGDFGSAKVTSYTGGSYNPSALNFYAQPSVSGENFQIVMPVVAGTNSKPFKWYAFE